MEILKKSNEVSLTVSDLARAKAFYSQVLGLGDPVYDMPEIGWAEWESNNSANLSVMATDENFNPAHHTTLVFTVNDCYKVVAELRKQGVQCDDPVPVPGVVTFASFYDPDGNRLQLCSPSQPEPGEDDLAE